MHPAPGSQNRSTPPLDSQVTPEASDMPDRKKKRQPIVFNQSAELHTCVGAYDGNSDVSRLGPRFSFRSFATFIKENAYKDT